MHDDPCKGTRSRETEGSGGPLREMTVLDLSTQLPGPYATMLLRALGARVIKVEPPGGDLARGIDPAMFARVNAGKEFIEVNLKTEDGRRTLHGLVRRADVFLEGFRPGVVRRLGVDFDALAQINPRLIYCSMSGFGQTGPLAGLPAHDVNLLALAGGVTKGSDYQHVSIPAVDLAAGSNAALAIAAAFAARPSSATYLDMSLLDAAVVWSAVKRMEPGEELEPSYGVFSTAMDGRVAVSVMEDDVWRRLCDALGWEDWSRDPALQAYADRRKRAEEIHDRLTEALMRHPQSCWLELAQRHQLPVTAVLDAQGAQSDPQVVTRGLTHRGLLQAPMPLGLRVPIGTPAGDVDAHGDELRREASIGLMEAAG